MYTESSGLPYVRGLLAGFTPYGPSRAATDALSHIMAADLAELAST